MRRIYNEVGTLSVPCCQETSLQINPIRYIDVILPITHYTICRALFCLRYAIDDDRKEEGGKRAYQIGLTIVTL
jgi:hypothetical protein